MGNDLPKIIINCGDPSGIGLDLIVFLAEKPFNASITILANKEALVQRAGLHGKKLAFQENVSLHKGDGRLYVKNIHYENDVIPGLPNKHNSKAQMQMIDYAVKECMAMNYDALVTLPISKEILSDSDNKFTGHTEYIAKLSNTKNQVAAENDLISKLNNIKNQISDGLPFAEAASQYSEDLSSAKKNGELGWVDRNNLLPEFQVELDNASNNSIVGPFKTAAGWHLIELIAKRDKDITEESQSLSARLQLLNYKAEIRYKDWFHDLKQQSNIEILTDN